MWLERVKFGIALALVGAVVGGVGLGKGIPVFLADWVARWVGFVVGLGAGFLFGASIISDTVSWVSRKGFYAPYWGEKLFVPFLAFLGAIFGWFIGLGVSGWNWEAVTLPSILPVVVGIVLCLFPGFAMAANHTRPVAGMVFSMLGGLTVLYIGFSLLGMSLLPHSLAWMGLVTGMIMCALSMLLLMYPGSSGAIGVFIIILSVLSMIGALGGYFIGAILGVLGGAMAVAWRGPAAGETEVIGTGLTVPISAEKEETTPGKATGAKEATSYAEQTGGGFVGVESGGPPGDMLDELLKAKNERPGIGTGVTGELEGSEKGWVKKGVRGKRPGEVEAAAGVDGGPETPVLEKPFKEVDAPLIGAGGSLDGLKQAFWETEETKYAPVKGAGVEKGAKDHPGQRPAPASEIGRKKIPSKGPGWGEIKSSWDDIMASIDKSLQKDFLEQDEK